jgi:hypothetical protein
MRESTAHVCMRCAAVCFEQAFVTHGAELLTDYILSHRFDHASGGFILITMAFYD